MTVLLLAVLAAFVAWVINRILGDNIIRWVARWPHKRIKAWSTLLILFAGIVSLSNWLLNVAFDVTESLMEWQFGDRNWLSADHCLFLATLLMALLGFHGTYQTMGLMRARRRPRDGFPTERSERFDLTKRMRWVNGCLTAVSFGVSLLFTRPQNPFSMYPLPILTGWLDPANWFGEEFGPALRLGGLVGLMRLSSSAVTNWLDKSRQWRPIERPARAWAAFCSGLISGGPWRRCCRGCIGSGQPGRLGLGQ